MSDTRSGQSSLPPGAIAALFERQREAAHEIQKMPSDTFLIGKVVPEVPISNDPRYGQITVGPMLIDPTVDVHTMAQTNPAGMHGYLVWAMGGADRVPTPAARAKEVADVSPQPTYRGKLTGPVRTLLSIFDRWKVDDRDAALFLGCDSVEFVKDLRVGTAGLNARDVRDRARYLIEIYEGVQSLLRDPAAERSWIDAPLEGLNGQSILGLMRRGSIADLLYVKSFIDHANGR